MKFNFLGNKKKLPQLTKVYKKKIIEGVSIPAIIHNGSYFFVDIHVYEDGRVYCWNYEDLEHFKKDVNRGWVAVTMPNKKAISIHGLGQWQIDKGTWDFTPKTFINYVMEIIKELNPNMKNIHVYNPKKINGITHGELGEGNVYREELKENSFYPERIDAKAINLYYKIDTEYYLGKVNIYEDEKIIIDRLPKQVELNLQAFEALIQDEIILTEIPINSKVNIFGLGTFTITKVDYSVDIDSMLGQIKDIFKTLKGEPTSIEVCRDVFEQYMKTPTNELKEQLKVAYEAVPEHERMYVGDMDTKDVAVRMIIYGEEEIENWLHYIVAKEQGEELPNIVVPKPKE